ncbi:MAG: NBR1-Ig-like domain-containing protein [Chloroflexi bacterium]|nr:NBR1-Ig-like domain-containing protein [Chloroflexota bacterium]
MSIPMAAPAEPGSYFNDWRFQDDQGNLFGDIVFVRIEVQSSGQETNDRSPTQYSAQIPIHFPLIREIEVTPLIYYRPWSVRTIKLVLTTPEPLPPCVYDPAISIRRKASFMDLPMIVRLLSLVGAGDMKLAPA